MSFAGRILVPRIPGGEITPDRLIAIGEVAKAYGLYTKITGGQRIDLFGARVGDLPAIWERLIAAGFESGHAYGKSMRTVKSCVGSTWCRFGVGDSVGFAIEVEQRYRGLRAPHKLKSAVSGCVRECAEAQSKDFGIIATENGWNLYVCGNGGATPRHADLLATDLDDTTCIRYIDRFLMFYIRTADKLTRTSVWLEKLEGGIEYLQQVVVNDSLGIADQLEAEMQALVDTYECEWKRVVNDPEKRARFRHFANSEAVDDSVLWMGQREQRRPVDWSAETDAAEPVERQAAEGSWVDVGAAADFPRNGGLSIRYGDHQLAVFHVDGTWYATQNLCPHKRDMVLARGLVGDVRGEPKVACPMHKKTFSLVTGEALDGGCGELHTFAARERDGRIELDLPPPAALDALDLAPTRSAAADQSTEL
jgi:nitrite reductase (NADH) large subunit